MGRAVYVTGRLKSSPSISWLRLLLGIDHQAAHADVHRPTVEATEAMFAEFFAEWEERYPAMIRLWRTSWEQLIPFLDFPPELRRSWL